MAKDTDDVDSPAVNLLDAVNGSNRTQVVKIWKHAVSEESVITPQRNLRSHPFGELVCAPLHGEACPQIYVFDISLHIKVEGDRRLRMRESAPQNAFESYRQLATQTVSYTKLTEVDQFDLRGRAVVDEEDVLVLQISVANVPRVHVRNGGQDAGDDAGRLLFGVGVTSVQVSARAQLHDDEELIPVEKRLDGPDDVGMIEGPQDPDLVPEFLHEGLVRHTG